MNEKKYRKKYKLDGASQCGITRDKERIEIKPYSTITKIRDTFSNTLKLRSMYVIDESGIEVDIDDSIIKRYFVEVAK